MKRFMSGPGVPPLPAVTQPSAEDVHDQAIVSALAGTKRLRDELAQCKDELDRERANLAASRHECEHVRAVAQQECTDLRERLADTTAKMEFYQRWSLELVTQVNDAEMMMRHGLGTVSEALNGSLNTVVRTMNEAMRQLTAFLDKVHEQARHREFRPNGAAPPIAGELESPEEQARLQDLAAKLAPDRAETVQ